MLERIIVTAAFALAVGCAHRGATPLEGPGLVALHGSSSSLASSSGAQKTRRRAVDARSDLFGARMPPAPREEADRPAPVERTLEAPAPAARFSEEPEPRW